MIATFVLFLREGLECSLIVSLLLTALRQLGDTRSMRAVWIGVVLAVVGCIAGGFGIFYTVHYYDGSAFEAIFEASAFLLAVVLLTGMTFWMQKHSRTLKSEITARAASAGSGLALGSLAFLTVGREGLETAFFTLAFAFQTNGFLLLSGALLGLLAAVVLCYLVYRLGYRIDYRVFFRVMGFILLFFAAGLLSNGVAIAQELHWLPFGTAAFWNTSALVSENTYLGELLHSLLGYNESPTILQVVAYVGYLAIFGVLFARLTRKPGPRQPARSSASSEVATGHARG